MYQLSSLTRPFPTLSLSLSFSISISRSLSLSTKIVAYSSMLSCFYDLSTKSTVRQPKKLSLNSESSRSNRDLRDLPEKSSDESEYEDCEEKFPDNESHLHVRDSNSEDDSAKDATFGFSSQGFRFLNSSNHSIRNRSINLLNSIDLSKDSRDKSAPKRGINPSSLIKKLRQNNVILSQKLAAVTRPVKSSIKLTRLLSSSIAHQQNLQSTSTAKHLKQVFNASLHTDSQAKESISNLHSTRMASGEELISTATLQQQESTTSSSTTKSTSPRALTSPSFDINQATSTSGISSNKRRKDKSQSTSLEDALSIIEERADDDEQTLNSNQLSVEPSSRLRLLSSSSSSKSRPAMIRSKEIDLNDATESGDGNYADRKETDLSSSSTDEDEANATNSSLTNVSTSTLEPKTTPAQPSTESSSSLLSSSSPSTSNLTDETIRAAKRIGDDYTTRPSSPKQLPTTGTSKPQLVNHHIQRSHTDVAQHSKRNTEGSTALFSSESLDCSKTTFNQGAKRSISPDFNLSQQKPQSGSGGGNFAQSVRAVKAQQQLLQHMIKHQNQNLLSSSDQKAKNAFMYPNRVYQSEYPFVTLKRYPQNMLQCTGGVVSVHSVKLLDHIINDEESETRDIWWTEIRKEIRSHAKALNCNTILGYSETSKVLGDVCLLSACGTAAVMKSVEQQQLLSTEAEEDTLKSATAHSFVNTNGSLNHSIRLSVSPHPLTVVDLSVAPEGAVVSNNSLDCNSTSTVQDKQKTNLLRGVLSGAKAPEQIDCSFCHSPLVCAESISSLANCSVCESCKVPDVLLLTIEPPQNLNIVSTGSLVQARVCRAKRDSHGEASAKEIGDALPFLEYELHRQLFTKLKFKGMNCLYNLNVDISVGENMLTGLATGTGCFVLGLPTPDPPQISAGKGIKTSRLNEIQQLIAASAHKNRESLGLNKIETMLANYHELRACESNLINKNQTEADIDENRDNERGERGKNLDSLSPTPGPAALDPNSDVVEKNNLMDRRQGNTSYYTVSNHNRLRALGDELFQHQHHHRHRRHHHHYSHHKKMQNFHERNNQDLAENLINLLTDDNNIVLEVDDNEDAEIITQLIDSDIPEGYLVCNSEAIPTIDQTYITSINMFTQVMRVKLTRMDQFAQQFDWILQALFVKLRRSLPCCLTNISFVVDLPESHIVQISVTGCLLGLKVNPSQYMLLEQAPKLVHESDVHDNHGAALDLISGSKSNQQRSHTSTTSMSPTSTSTSSSNSSSSPSSTSAVTSPQSSSSDSSSSVHSVKEATTIAVQKNPDVSKSFTKKISNSGIAALIGSKASGIVGLEKKKTLKETNDIELTDRQAITEAMATSTKENLDEQKLAIQQPVAQRILSNQQPFQSMKAVFKKQLTYPGATSPEISGQDKLLPSLEGAGASVSSTNAARRATSILNKVKQPLKELGSNFNHAAASSAQASNASSSPLAATSSVAKAVNGVAQPESDKLKASISSSSSVPVGGFSNKAKQAKKSSLNKTERASMETSDNCKPTGGGVAVGAAASALGNLVSKIDRATNSSIDITSLSYIPGAKEYHYLGNLSFSFVRETNSVRENGGLNGFIHCFLMEVYAIVRAHVSALGGNAFLSFRLQQSCIFYHSNKNQAQCLISVAGDAVQVAI